MRHLSAVIALAALAACGGGGGGGTGTDAAPASASPATGADGSEGAAPGATAPLASTGSTAAATGTLSPTTGTATGATPSATPSATTTTTAVTATCGLPDFVASAMARVNQYRASGASCRSRGYFGPASPLAWNSLLYQAAAGHSVDMATNNYFSHTSLDGRSMATRINATGYAWSNIGENIAAGQRTVNAVVDGWMASDGHCANLMNPAFRDVGLACASNTASTYRMYWTMNLARPR